MCRFLFDILQNDVNDFSSEGSVYLVGDFNSRTSVKHDYVINDEYNNAIDDDDYVVDVSCDRVSMDTTCNAFDVKLLDFCKAT
jgi:hypothetical protein